MTFPYGQLFKENRNILADFILSSRVAKQHNTTHLHKMPFCQSLDVAVLIKILATIVSHVLVCQHIIITVVINDMFY